MEILFRPATQADLSFVAWCNYKATSPKPGFSYWEPLLEDFNTSVLKFIETVLAHNALSWGQVEDFVLGTYNGKPVCGASGFVMPSHDYSPLRLDCLPRVAEALHWPDQYLTIFKERYEQVWSDPHEETLKPSGEWTIECVAVAEQFRKQGLGKQLITSLLDAGKKRECRSAGIAVTLDNSAAEALYKSVGFQSYITYWAAYFEGYYPGSHKFRKML